MKVQKHCVSNEENRCIQCRCRRVPKSRKRVCPLYSLLKKKDPVELYERLVNETTELRKKIDELEDTIQFVIQHPRTGALRHRRTRLN